MAFAAKVLCDSINPDGQKLRTVLATYPRFIHAEIMTHRDRARNSASSRAISWKRKGKNRKTVEEMLPGERVIGHGMHSEISLDSDQKYEYWVANCMYAMILQDPVVPIKWGAENPGMQTGGEVDPQTRERARQIWLESMRSQVAFADQLAELGVHKSLCNRLTEPFMWITVVMSATEWNNFFRLRVHPDAEIHFQKIAGMIKDALDESTPKPLMYGHWHLPFIDPDERDEVTKRFMAGDFDDLEGITQPLDALKYISAGRCARVSYLTHDGVRDFTEDIKLTRKLIVRSDDVIHASPLEHTAMSSHKDMRSGPFRGWKQMRKEFPNENVEG